MNNIIASPQINDTWTLITEWRQLSYRGRKYPCAYRFYRDNVSREQFTTTTLDEVNLRQIHNQYRTEKGIPFVDEIKALRQRYGLSLSLLSKILGFGSNQYRYYEDGEMPSVSNGRMLRSLIACPIAFAALVETAGADVSDKERQRLLSLAHETDDERQTRQFTQWLYGGACVRNGMNGYAPYAVNVVKDSILYILNKIGATYKTKMCKLLFYADMLAYKRYGIGLTGLRYIAIDYGPVPKGWERIYTAFSDIRTRTTYLSDGGEGEQLVATAEATVLSAEQTAILDEVCNIFGDMTAYQISEYSHEERAWRDNKDTHGGIDYAYAFAIHI